MPKWPEKVIFDASDKRTFAIVSQLKSAACSGQLIPWTGAGISVDPPANLPDGKQLENPLQKALCQAAHSFIKHTDKVLSKDLKKQIKTFRLEQMLESLQRVYGRNFVMDYIKVLDQNIWNKNHAMLAALANSGFISSCVTLNFDCLLELAHASFGRSKTICPLKNDSFCTGSGPLQLEIIKPHGSFYLNDSENRNPDLLCGAISEIGDRPSNANRQVIRQAIIQCPIVLIIGYSNHDWDISPILFELRKELNHIYWIEHSDNPKKHKPNTREIRVRELLKTFSIPSTIIITNTSSLLQNLTKELGVEIPPPPNNVGEQRQPPDTSFLIETQKNREQTALATSLILRHGTTRRFLMNELLKIDTFKKTPSLNAVLMKATGMTNYSNVQEITERMKSVTNLNFRNTTDDNAWHGYQYLRKVIRPWPLTNIFFLPLNIFRAWRYFQRAIRYSTTEKHEVNTQPERDYISSSVTKARFFYPAQVPHGWAENFMFFGKSAKPFVRLFAWLSLHLYRKAEQDNKTMMTSEYFWMRHLQARILAGHCINRKVVEKHLLEIDNFFCDLHDDAHKMTVYMCQAFIESQSNSSDDSISKLLDKAEEAIISHERFDRQEALIRVLLYRRYFTNQPSLTKAIANIRTLV